MCCFIQDLAAGVNRKTRLCCYDHLTDRKSGSIKPYMVGVALPPPFPWLPPSQVFVKQVFNVHSA